jgi:hypothetical protein
VNLPGSLFAQPACPGLADAPGTCRVSAADCFRWTIFRHRSALLSPLTIGIASTCNVGPAGVLRRLRMARRSIVPIGARFWCSVSHAGATQASRLTSFGRGEESTHSITRFNESGERQSACMTRWASSWDRRSLNKIRLVPSLSSSTTRYIANGSKRRKQAGGWHTDAYGHVYCGIIAGPVAIRIWECCQLTVKIGRWRWKHRIVLASVSTGVSIVKVCLITGNVTRRDPGRSAADQKRGGRGRRCDQGGRIRHGH